MNRRLILVLLLIVTFAVLGRCVWGEFSHLDDLFTIAGNPRLNPPTAESLAYYWDPRNPEYSLYIPVTYTVWTAVASISRVPGEMPGSMVLNPWMFHATNLFVHCLAVLMVFAILRRLVRSDLAAMFGALIFAIHPLQVESVAWVSGLKDVLAGFFAVFAVWCYVNFADDEGSPAGATASLPLPLVPEGDRVGVRGSIVPNQRNEIAAAGRSPLTPALSPEYEVEGERRSRGDLEDDNDPLSPNARWGFYAMGLLALILGMLSKPAVMTVPLLAAVIDRFLLKRSWREAIVFPGIWQIIVLPIMWIAQFTQPAIGVPRAPIWARPLIALDSITFYVGKLILPFNLAVDYGRSPQGLIASGVLWWTMLVPVALAIVIIVLRKDIREIVASALIFMLAPLPTLGLVTLLFSYMSTVADHYIYLAMLGPALLVAGVVAKYGKSAAYTFACVLAIFAYLSFKQAGRWQNDVSLFSHNLEVNGASYLAASNLGTVYYDMGEFALARDTFERGVHANPQHFQSMIGYGLSLIQTGAVDDGIGVCYDAMSIKAQQPPEIRGDLTAPLYHIAEALMSKGRKEEAIGFIRLAMQAMPDKEAARQLMEELEKQSAATQPTSAPSTLP